MNFNINQDNLHLLLPGKLSWMTEMHMTDHNSSVVEALRALYQSPLYSDLECESTKLWHYGPVALYEMWQENNKKN